MFQVKRVFVVLFICAFVVSGGLVGCAGSNAEVQEDEWGMDFGPKWAQSPPKEEGRLFEAASAESPTLNTALRRANHRATQQIATALRQNIESWEEDYVQEMGQAADAEVLTAFESLSQRTAAETLSNVEEVERAVQRSNGVYTAWVLVSVDPAEALSGLEEMERLETEFSREQARKQLEKRRE